MAADDVCDAPRLDLLSLRATRTFGWMELGFQEEYFYRLLLRGGWLPRKHLCPLTDRGTLYTARKNTGQVSAGGSPAPPRRARSCRSSDRRPRTSPGRRARFTSRSSARK
jgi:hypothetical protein